MQGLLYTAWAFVIFAGWLLPVALVVWEVYSSHRSTRGPRRRQGRMILFGVCYAITLITSLCLALVWTGWIWLFAFLVLIGLALMIYIVGEAIYGNLLYARKLPSRNDLTRFEVNEDGSIKVAAECDNTDSSNYRPAKWHTRRWRTVRMGRYGLWK